MHSSRASNILQRFRVSRRGSFGYLDRPCVPGTHGIVCVPVAYVINVYRSSLGLDVTICVCVWFGLRGRGVSSFGASLHVLFTPDADLQFYPNAVASTLVTKFFYVYALWLVRRSCVRFCGLGVFRLASTHFAPLFPAFLAHVSTSSNPVAIECLQVMAVARTA